MINKTDELQRLIKDSQWAHKEIQENILDCAENRWLSKKVISKKEIPLDMSFVKLNGIGSLDINDEKFNKKCIELTTNTDIEDKRPRPFSEVQVLFEGEDWQKYNRVSMWIYPESVGFQNFYFHFNLMNNGKGQLHAPSLTPNKWNHIVWEITYLEKDCVQKLGMGPIFLGVPPEAEAELKVYFTDIEIQKVDEDYVEGWKLDDRIAYCHSGYLPNSEKVAITQVAENNKFSLFDIDKKEVFVGDVKKVESDFGVYYSLDFSSFTKTGTFYLQIDDRRTPTFMIDDKAFDSSIWKSINFLRMLRCGDDVENVHSPCHLNSYTTHEDGRMVPNFGGWHDAGDVSQFEICTAEMAHAVVDLAEALEVKDKVLSERLLEEARYGLNWLLRTRFGDGTRALAVLYSVWKKNVVKGSEAFNPPSPMQNVAENGPFENFLSSAALAAAARVFKGKDDIFADWCLRCAKEDFKFAVYGHENGYFTRRWGPGAPSQVCGAGALAAAELYAVTKDENYLNQGDKYANVVLSCQEKDYPKWEVPLRGFFYEDPEHSKMLTYEHRGHEQTPVQGLTRLCEVAKNHPNYLNWKKGIMLYVEYILSTSEKTEPYGLLPAHVYDVNKLNLTRFTIPSSYKEKALDILTEQIKQGIRLNEDVYLRRFPIAIQRRGFHATLLSKTKAVSAIAKLLNNQELKQIAINQLEWVLGKNPFASSTMYGEGHNYHPLYVAFSRQIVGALPVGIETYESNDAPFWPVVNNAVFKEIWGHTTGKYLWIIADLY